MPPAILLIALFLPTAGAAVYFVAADPNSPMFRLTYAASKFVQFALPIAALAAFDRNRLRAIRINSHGLLGGFAIGVLIAGAILAAYFGAFRGGEMFASLAIEVRTKVAGFGLDSRLGFVGLAVAISVGHSFLEEYYWRWFVHAELRERIGRSAVVVSSLGFAAHHVVVLAVYFPSHFWTVTVPFSLGVAIGGAIWAAWYDRSGSLAGPWAAHLLTDLAIMAIGFDLLYPA